MELYTVVLTLLFTLAPLGIVGLILLYRLAGRALSQTEKMQGDHKTIISELLAANVVKETNDQYTAGQILGHSNAHDMRRHDPPVPQSFVPDANDLPGPHVSPDIQYGLDDDVMSPPLPGQET